jgi:two-component system, NtrC family, sensor kinase
MTLQVLIVDDSPTVRAELSDAFSSVGFVTHTSADAAQARQLLAREQLDVLILDVQLPDADGVELLREVRESAAGEPLTILMLSGQAEVEDRVRGLGSGADEYIGKPYDVDYVVRRARELAELRRGSAARSGKDDELRPGVVAGPQQVLIIDDSPTFRMHLQLELQDAGYEVQVADSGEAGLRCAAADRPQAIIVDGLLPGMDGSTFIRRIRLDAALRAVPCILLTGSDDSNAELRALESGADAFVRKDRDLQIILARLAALMRNSQAAEAVGHGTRPLAGKKILAIDDDAGYREQIAAALFEEGYDVIPASSPEAALELLTLQSVDCILLDLLLGGLGGPETCRRIKGSPLLRDVPVILLASAEDRQALLDGLAAGADDCMAKSAGLDVLKARVQAALRRRQIEDETRRMREQVLRGEIQVAAASSARELAETRAELVRELEHKNKELHGAYEDLKSTQSQLVQSAKMASLGELVAGVAHEINNPLAFVLSHLDTVRRSLSKVHPDPAQLPEPAREPWQRANSRLQEMQLGLERIRELVVKLRSFSRLDEGECKRVSMRECVESLLTILSHKTRDRIQVVTEFGEPDQIECYPGPLNQAIMNLVANSIDAIEGEGAIRIATGRTGDHYEISVSDTGCGIPEDLRERVLEPFFTTKPVGQGTGLGLSIAYSIVRKHKGTLTMTAARGGGTLATIRIPLDGHG